MSRLQKWLDPYLPAYANDTISIFPRIVLALCLRFSSQVRERLAEVQVLVSSVQDQGSALPSADVYRRIQTQLLLQPKTGRRYSPSFLAPVALIIILAITLSIIFWTTPPGIILQWTVERGQPENFRILRSTVGEQTPQFSLVRELAATAEGDTYQFIDFRSLPGQKYVYQVEAIDGSGQKTASQIVIGNGLRALPGQIAVLFVLAISLIHIRMFLNRLKDSAISLNAFIMG